MENKKLTDIEKKFCFDISWFFKEELKWEYKDFLQLGITDISYEESYIESHRKQFLNIRLYRPGLLIGKKGETINALTNYLRKNQEYQFMIINIIENNIPSYLSGAYTIDDIDWIDVE